MNAEFYQKNIHFLEVQRNTCFAWALLSSLSLIIVTIFLFSKEEKVIVVPSVIEKEFWVDSKNVSATYLEQMGCFLGKLLLEKSPFSASMQRKVLLRHTDPSYVGILNRKLLEEEDLLLKQNASYVFFPIDVRVDLKNREIHLIGDRTTYLADKLISTAREGYRLSFNTSSSTLLLKSVTATEENTK
jgi:conjugal transfer pilus assembly protein TraE